MSTNHNPARELITKSTLNLASWSLTALLQAIMGFSAGVATLQLIQVEAPISVLVLWLAITLGVFLVGAANLLIRRVIRQNRFPVRLVITAFGGLIPLALMSAVVLSQSKGANLLSNEVSLALPFLAILFGLIGFHISDLIKGKTLQLTIFGFSILIAATLLLIFFSKSEPRPMALSWSSTRACGSGLTSYLVPDGDVFSYIDSFAFYQNFEPACIAHDKCYGTCGSPKRECDGMFLDDLDNACKKTYSFGIWKPLAWVNPLYYKCAGQASLYFIAVDNFGGNAYDDAQQHCGKPAYKIEYDCRVTSTCGGLTSSSTKENNRDYWALSFVNKCNVNIRAAVSYRDFHEKWLTTSWIPISPGQRMLVASTRYKIYYMYAETIAPLDKRIFWQGHDDYSYIDNSGTKYGFIKYMITMADWGEPVVNLECPDR